MKWRNIKSDIFQNSLVKSQKFILQWTSIYNYELETQSKVTQNIFLISRPISNGVKGFPLWQYIMTVHIVKKILPSKDDSEELLLSSISSSPAIIDVTNGLLIMAKCVDLRDRDFLEPRRLELLLAAMASLESRLIGCSINVWLALSAKYLVFVSSPSVKMRELSFAQFVYFLRKKIWMMKFTITCCLT